MAKILICDDHPFMLMGTKTYIEGLGHHVCELCANGINAYNMIVQHNPDIALLDLSMPGMNGLEVLEKLQTAPVRTKVILLTMHKEISIVEKKVLELIGRQHTTKKISTMLFIAEKTVENHRSNIMKKLDLPPEKNALLKWAIKHLGEGV